MSYLTNLNSIERFNNTLTIGRHTRYWKVEASTIPGWKQEASSYTITTQTRSIVSQNPNSRCLRFGIGASLIDTNRGIGAPGIFIFPTRFQPYLGMARHISGQFSYFWSHALENHISGNGFNPEKENVRIAHTLNLFFHFLPFFIFPFFSRMFFGLQNVAQWEQIGDTNSQIESQSTLKSLSPCPYVSWFRPDNPWIVD